jgi:hypothetical protein
MQGGPRAGAGRPRKEPDFYDIAEVGHNTEPQRNETPLEYCLRVMNDIYASPERRDRMAQAALPYTAINLTRMGKKESKQERAEAVKDTRFLPVLPPERRVVDYNPGPAPAPINLHD